MFIILSKKNTHISENFNARVMSRVCFIFYVKKVLNPVFLEICGLLALATAGTAFVSLKNVFSNSPAIINLPQSFSFWLGAYFKSEIQLKIIIIAMAFLGELLLFRAIKNIIGIETRTEGLVKLIKLMKSSRALIFG